MKVLINKRRKLQFYRQTFTSRNYVRNVCQLIEMYMPSSALKKLRIFQYLTVNRFHCCQIRSTEIDVTFGFGSLLLFHNFCYEVVLKNSCVVRSACCRSC